MNSIPIYKAYTDLINTKPAIAVRFEAHPKTIIKYIHYSPMPCKKKILSFSSGCHCVLSSKEKFEDIPKGTPEAVNKKGQTTQ